MTIGQVCALAGLLCIGLIVTGGLVLVAVLYAPKDAKKEGEK